MMERQVDDKDGLESGRAQEGAPGTHARGSGEPQAGEGLPSAEQPHEGRSIAPPANNTGKMDPNCKREGGSRISN